VVRAYAEEFQNNSNLRGRKASKSTVKDSGGKYANPNAEDHARYAQQLRQEEPRSHREEFEQRGFDKKTTSLRGQAKAANFGRANAGKLHKVHGDRRRNSSGLRVSVSWKAPEKLK